MSGLCWGWQRQLQELRCLAELVLQTAGLLAMREAPQRYELPSTTVSQGV